MSNLTDILNGLPAEHRDIVEAAIKGIVERKVRDTKNRMLLVKELRAGPLRLEAVEFEGKLTYTMCFDNDVMAHMGEEAAKAFCRFVEDEPRTLRPQMPPIEID